MATSKVTYIGELRTSSTHIKSGEEIITDAPVDNQGKGEAFSPTDLLANSLASCILTVIGIAARTHRFNIDGATAQVTKYMGENPRRVVGIKVDLQFPKNNYSDKQKAIIENAARTCPVAFSLHPEIKKEINFGFND